MSLLDRLKQWQATQAAREGVEPWRVLPYPTLAAIARERPTTELALLQIKGIGAMKVRRYGAALLMLVAEDSAPRASQTTGVEEGAPRDCATGEVTGDAAALTVTEFLAALNAVMATHLGDVRIRGEVADFRRNHTGHAYFSLKDAASIVRITVFRGAYDLSGVELADGVEIIVTGRAQHHQQYGFSVIAQTVEVAGEGALKKAYDALKRRLDADGLLDPARKRSLPVFPTRIGLVTSRDGAAIGDFMTNLGRYGLQIAMMHSPVEGQHAIHGLTAALARMATLAADGRIDTLVVTRGGGSLESLQAFNNEHVVRALAAFPVPVVAGIGHERDETLATLVADVGVSTPTAAARAICAPWEDAARRSDVAARSIFNAYQTALVRTRQRLLAAPQTFLRPIMLLTERFRDLHRRFDGVRVRCAQSIRLAEQSLVRVIGVLDRSASRGLQDTQQRLEQVARVLAAHDPHRRLTQGYAIVRAANGHVVRSVADVSAGDALSIQVSDGTIGAVAR